MEIGAEISKKIRAAIKGKLQELGAYIDEELPDYIMVMVANKKTSQQMADDLSLFLGNNTIKFTAWLQGVLEKLRSVSVEPASLKHQPQSDGDAVSGKSRSPPSEDDRVDEPKMPTASSSRSERTQTRMSSSAHESRRGALEKSSSRLTSAVRPLMELLPSEAVIDIKPEMDDDLIAEDPVEMATSHVRSRGTASRPTAEIYRPGQSRFSLAGSAHPSRPAEGSSHSRQQDGRGSRASRTGSSKEDLSRKRKAPVASSVVRVSQTADEDSDEFEEEDPGHGGRGVSSRVSLPSKPERKPTLPPAKQANRNLILKAISEAQDSITKTTSYPTIPQRQTVPVAPRARLASSEEMTAALQLVQEHLHSLAPRVQAHSSAERLPSRAPAPVRSLASRLQLDLAGRSDAAEQSDDAVEVAAGGDAKAFDTRSFILGQRQLQDPPAGGQQGLQAKGEVQSAAPPALPRTVQASKERGDSASPKFIVTLDGVPSPLGNFGDTEMELDDVRPPMRVTEAPFQRIREPKVGILHRLQGGVAPAADGVLDVTMAEEDAVPVKKQKAMERCKFWPVCKSGDECSYHHPTAQCKTFPGCKFGDKCLFVHPNCKYDARCTKTDCPFTHVSRRSRAGPPPRPAVQPVQVTSVCRFFPDCKKMDCPFFHPKPCRFAALCKRSGCTFYHPNTSVPPRHALKWTKTQSS